MMPMTPNNALYLVNQHNQDLLREAEMDRLCNEARSGSARSRISLLAPLQAAVAAIVRMGQQQVSEQVRPAMEKAQSGAKLPATFPAVVPEP
jgi:hypothetical protein